MNRCRRPFRLLWGLAILLWVAGCQQTEDVTPLAQVDMSSLGPSSTSSLSPTSTLNVFPSSTPFPPPATLTPIPSLTPTSTPLPTATPIPVRLALPANRQALIARALEQLDPSPWSWQLIAHPDPAQAVAQGVADVAVVPENAGIIGVPVGNEPLALIVPFTDRRETIQDEGLQINGYPFCTPIPEQFPCWQRWRDLQPPYKALTINGLLPFADAYPFRQGWFLLGQEDVITTLAPVLQAEWGNDPLIHLVGVGDITLDRSLNWYNLAVGKLEAPFAEVADVLRSADITVGNMESALGDVGEPAPKSYTFRAPPVAAESLALAGFDIVSLANNHALDYGLEALLQGIDLLNEQGVTPIGAGKNATDAHTPHIITIHDIKVAFLAYVHVPPEWHGFDNEIWTATETEPGVAWGNPDEIRADVTYAKTQADVVVVVLHSGWEYIEEPSDTQVAAALAATEAGAALVIGHHAHIPQGLEFTDSGQAIAYGLGNFAFDIEGDPESLILHVWLDRDGVRLIQIMPAIVQYGGYPRVATPIEANAIRQHVYFLTQQLQFAPRNQP